MLWYSHLSKNFSQFVVIHTVKDFSVVNEAEAEFFSLLCFFYNPADVGNLFSASSAFAKSSLCLEVFGSCIAEAYLEGF